MVGGVVAPVVIIWPNGVRVELGVDAVSGAVLSAMHVVVALTLFRLSARAKFVYTKRSLFAKTVVVSW